MNKRTFLLRAAGLAAVALLASCGGGGGGGDEPEAPSASYWTMDSYLYQSGGYSSQSTTMVGTQPRTVVTVSTATPAGGDKANGDFSGSALAFAFNGTAPGVYVVVPSKAALTDPAVPANAILVESTVGISQTTGSILYTASSGTVSVSIDAGGKYHFDTANPLPMAKTLDVLGGIKGAPATMGLVLHDAT